MTAVSSVPIPYIDATGFHLPAFEDILAAHQADYRGVYGQDVVLTSDVQDGEWIAIEATALNDTFALSLAVYNSFSPSTAQGAGLSSVVKINGIARETASYSTCDVTVIGVAGTVLTGAQVRDEADILWALPPSVIIPLSGTITVTATCLTLGAVSAPVGTIDQIATPTRGWQSVSNATAAVIGSPVEQDPQLRIRQSKSTALPSRNILDGLIGSVANLSGVVRLRGYENDTDVVDANGQPGHSISLVVDGGDATSIAQVINLKKGVAGTYGTAVVAITSAQGITRNITFFRPSEPPITWVVTLKALPGFTSDVEAAIAQSLADWTNALGIGNSILLTRAYGPALLPGSPLASAYELQSLAVARDSNTPLAADVTIAFNEAASSVPSAVSFVVNT